MAKAARAGKAGKSTTKKPAAKKPAAKKPAATQATDAAKEIDRKIAELNDWRGATLAKIRAIIREAVPDVTEEVKWRGVPVWSKNGIICTGETYKAVVKMTFAKGASLKDPKGLFNSSLEGNTRRAIDIREVEKIDEKALGALVEEAVEVNRVPKERSGKR